MSWSDLLPLLSVAASCSVMIITQSAATARVYAARHEQELDENADLAGLSAANAVAGLSGTFVVNGSPRRRRWWKAPAPRARWRSLQLRPSWRWFCFSHPAAPIPAALCARRAGLHDRHPDDQVAHPAGYSPRKPGGVCAWLFSPRVVVAAGVEQGILLAMILSLFRIVQHSYRPTYRGHVSQPVRNLGLNPVTPGAMTEPGLVHVPLWSGALLRQRQPVCRKR